MERFISHTYFDALNKNYADFVHRLKRDLDENGLAVIEKFIAPTFLLEMVEMVERLTPDCYEGEKRKPLIGSDLEGTIFYKLAFSAWLIKLANDLLKGFNVEIMASDVYPAINILLGEKGQDTVDGWHFDATYLTIAVPIVMPNQKLAGSGSFHIWSNVRHFSQSKIADKCYCNLMRFALIRNLLQQQVINFIPGNMYILAHVQDLCFRKLTNWQIKAGEICFRLMRCSHIAT